MRVLSDIDTLVLVGVVAAVTFLIRLLPFILARGLNRFSFDWQTPQKLLPAAILAVLLIYALRDVSFTRPGAFLPQLISVLIVAALHLWKRNTLLSIGLGTFSYMFFIQVVWPS